MDERAKLLDKANRHYAKKEHAKAIEAYSKYLQLNPSDAQTAGRLGDCYALTGNKDKSIRYYAKAAELYALAGSVMKAIGLHKRVLTLDPSMADPNTYLSYLELSRLEAEKKIEEETGVPFLREEPCPVRTPAKAPSPPGDKAAATPPADWHTPLPKARTLPPTPSREEVTAPEPVVEVKSPEPVFELETTSQVEPLGSTPPQAEPPGQGIEISPSGEAGEPVFEIETTSQAFTVQEPKEQEIPLVPSAPPTPPQVYLEPETEPPLEPVLEIETTSQIFTVREPADKGIPLELLSPLTEIPPEAPPPPPPPEIKKPLPSAPVSIQAEQDALIKKLEESSLRPPVIPSPAKPLPPREPEAPLPPPSIPEEEKIPVFELEAETEELEAPAAPLDLGGEEFDFQIEVVPEAVELPRQKPGEVTVEKPPELEVSISESAPPGPGPALEARPSAPSYAPGIPEEFELSLPEAHEVPLREMPSIPAEPPLPQPLKPSVMDLTVTPIKTSQPSFKIPLLKELTPQEFIRVCEKLRVHRLKKDTVLFRQGDPGDSLFFINSGKVKIYLGAGGEEETLAYLKEGELFGEFAFLTGAPRQANVKTDRETELLELSREDLEPLLASYPGIKEALISFYKERALNNVLNQTVIFRPLGKIEKALVASNLNYKSYPKGEVIIQEGTMGDELYFLVTGKVRVTTYHGLVFLADLYPPELFGEISLITNQPRTATVTAATPVEVLYLKKDQLLELLRRYPKMQKPLNQLYESRLRDTADKMQSAKKSKAEGGAPYLT